MLHVAFLKLSQALAKRVTCGKMCGAQTTHRMDIDGGGGEDEGESEVGFCSPSFFFFVSASFLLGEIECPPFVGSPILSFTFLTVCCLPLQVPQGNTPVTSTPASISTTFSLPPFRLFPRSRTQHPLATKGYINGRRRNRTSSRASQFCQCALELLLHLSISGPAE